MKKMTRKKLGQLKIKLTKIDIEMLPKWRVRIVEELNRQVGQLKKQ